jgi:hypothetical protein
MNVLERMEGFDKAISSFLEEMRRLNGPNAIARGVLGQDLVYLGEAIKGIVERYKCRAIEESDLNESKDRATAFLHSMAIEIEFQLQPGVWVRDVEVRDVETLWALTETFLPNDGGC